MKMCWDSDLLANSVDPDQTAQRAVWSGSTLFAIHLEGFNISQDNY